MLSSYRSSLALALVAAGLAAAPLAHAQQGSSKPSASVEEAFSNLDTPQPANREELEREKLNQSQAEFAARQLEDNAASRREMADYEQALRDHEATVARIRDEDAAAQAAFEAERVRREQDHEAALARWRADVAACNAGEISRCTTRQ
jgi:hypothetical protein